ncbi:hypothetical protein EIP91_005835 [Steccherinum ochraceum]|uniref:F-box domain-containing protein n=1 Tax=Steccherinum ochraceum TaxID=92696 RepID=A0A4R0R6Y3_9APHY|nr:hypothetical protein EIP91_005835 [Steccherinum ochraceum]
MIPAPQLISLPVEIWENVLDFVADGLEARTSTLLACSLTRRAWVSRCRYHLFRTVTLSSCSDVLNVVHLLSQSPLLAPRVTQLILIASVEADQQWISSVPLRLGGKLSRLSGVTMKGLDLRDRHPDFYKAWVLSRPITYLVLENVRYTRYAQLCRFAVATQAQEFSIKDEGGFVQSRTPTSLRHHPGSFMFVTIDLLSLELILSWPQLIAFSRDYCKIAGSRLSKIRVRVEVGGLQKEDIEVPELSPAASLFRRLCTHAPLAYLEMKVTTSAYTVAMMHGDRWGWMVPARQTKLDLTIWPADAKQYPQGHIRHISHLLKSLSSPRFDVLAVTLIPAATLSESRNAPETDTLAIEPLVPQWQFIDEVLALPTWTHLVDFKIRLGLHTHDFPEPHQSIPDLMEKLLPRLCSRNVPAEFYVSRSYLESQLKKVQRTMLSDVLGCLP